MKITFLAFSIFFGFLATDVASASIYDPQWEVIRGLFHAYTKEDYVAVQKYFSGAIEGEARHFIHTLDSVVSFDTLILKKNIIILPQSLLYRDKGHTDFPGIMGDIYLCYIVRFVSTFGITEKSLTLLYHFHFDPQNDLLLYTIGYPYIQELCQHS